MSDSLPLSDVETLKATLRRFGWSPVGGQPNVYEVWSVGAKDGNETEGPGVEDEVIVPLDSERGDFRSLLVKAERKVSGLYAGDAKRVLDTLKVSKAVGLEATRWSKETAFDAGLIPWQQGEALFSSARAQLAAAAKASREQRPYFGKSGSYLARRFIDSTYMGQTDIGSFVITAFTPADTVFYVTKRAEQEARNSQLPAGEVVTGREIIDRFVEALTAVREGLETYRQKQNVAVFQELVPSGVSHELLKALSQFTSNGNSEIEVGAGTSAESRVVKFQANEAPVLAAAATGLAGATRPIEVTVIGEVTLLRRERDSDRRVIRLEVVDGPGIRMARARLSLTDYATAVEAHRVGAWLSVTGRLERRGNVFWIESPRDVEVVRPN